ncbi:hypothetical protein TNCV_1330231 [Trichonephila clavipes]|uniref:Uncharacterized protein n=1 Tax=Trichonephila clavipes TaxID=2585209 RepID=A0A8X6R8L3_TRICX|nr:hypothetical protein TNCV_1330231 [Trichonephila clavipes]
MQLLDKRIVAVSLRSITLPILVGNLYYPYSSYFGGICDDLAASNNSDTADEDYVENVAQEEGCLLVLQRTTMP